MAILTKDDVYNKMVEDKRPVCPHCNEEMLIWECPMMTFSDGLGWGTPYLYVCFNNDCPLYLGGWEEIYEKYAKMASVRCICDPMSGNMDCMPVYSREGGTAQIIDEEIKAEEEARKEAETKGLEELTTLHEARDAEAILGILVSGETPPGVRLKAAEMTGELGEVEAIEPIRNCVFDNELIKEKAEESIALIHERNYTKECPFCTEIIKARAVVCKHCNKDLPEA
ncbi:MAG: zinc ribbon domain-containing protein [Deltaproteobacteria bacterium]|nr:zinc ribbon domain-containing protein [Deltaproteobacteria bacterium]